jgi:hypothetical protein
VECVERGRRMRRMRRVGVWKRKKERERDRRGKGGESYRRGEGKERRGGVSNTCRH